VWPHELKEPFKYRITWTPTAPFTWRPLPPGHTRSPDAPPTPDPTAAPIRGVSTPWPSYRPTAAPIRTSTLFFGSSFAVMYCVNLILPQFHNRTNAGARNSSTRPTIVVQRRPFGRVTRSDRDMVWADSTHDKRGALPKIRQGSGGRLAWWSMACIVLQKRS